MRTDKGQELESKAPVSPGLVMRVPGAEKELVVPVPPPLPPGRTHQSRFWRNSEQLQKSTQLRRSHDRSESQACKLLAGWWRHGEPSKEFQHAQHHDKNLSTLESRSRPSRGHGSNRASWWDWRPGTTWRRDSDLFNQQLAQWNYYEQQKHALNIIRALPCYNGDEDVQMRWRDHVCKSDSPVHEATRVQQALLRLEVQGYATSDVGRVHVFDSEWDQVNTIGCNASCTGRVQENARLQDGRRLSDASTEYVSQRWSTRSEEEYLPDVATAEEAANDWRCNEDAHQELLADTRAHALSFDSKDGDGKHRSENLCVEHGVPQACNQTCCHGLTHALCASAACVQHCSSPECSALARSPAPGLIHDESQYERRRRERRSMRNRGSRDLRKEIESRDSPVVDVLDPLRQLDGNIFRQGSKMGLLVGWLLGRMVSVVLFQLMQLGTGRESMKALQLESTPVHWVAACLVAVWLGSASVNWMGSHPSWQLGCLAAWVFTFIS
eukprot:TRINITY_DN15050_c0_g1_i1.p1 TRINITY_DN15050_c0_g1~~TRINITY_DN15050_c0_g1_i1.p1  ORF type:complete len:497 (+),score=56.02 TRINITY_DN15050_c0_g1_i1:85-1575(+)